MSNIQQNLAKILSSRYGKDVRQSIHDSIQTCATNSANAVLEAQAATAIAEGAQLYADAMASGSPVGVYATVLALETALPTGGAGAYLVEADSHLYFWDSVTSAWIDGGEYNVAHASKVSITDTDGYYDALNVEDALKEIGHRTSGVVSVKEYGATGDGVTDDTAAIQSALTNVPQNGTLFFPDGVYLASFVITKPINIVFSKNAKLRVPTGKKFGLIVRGTVSAEKHVLVNPLSRGDTQIELMGANSIQSGDLIYIRDDAVRFHDSLPDINYEIHEVASVSGTTITLRDFIRDPKAISLTGDNVAVINPVSGVFLDGIKIEGDYDNKTALANGGIYVVYARDIKITNFSMKYFSLAGIELLFCYNCRVDGFLISDAINMTAAGTGYGIQFNKVMRGTINNGLVTVSRHPIDLSTSYDVLVTDVISMSTPISTAFVIAHNVYGSDITFRDCKAYDCASYGFITSAQQWPTPYAHTNHNINILNCDVQVADDISGVVYGVNFEMPVEDSVISGLRVKCRDGSVASLDAIGVVLYGVNNSITLRDCVISGFSYGVMFRCEALASLITLREISNISLINVIFERCNSAIRLQGADSVYVSGATVLDCTHLFDMYYSTNTPRLRKFTVRNVFYSGLTNLYSTTPNNYMDLTDAAVGTISNINNSTHKSTTASTITQNINLSVNQTFMRALSGNLLKIKSKSAVSMGTSAFAKGTVIGQRLTLICTSAFDITIPKAEYMIFLLGATDIVLNSEATSTASFLWDGAVWYQIS